MKLSVRLILSFLLVSILPLAAVGYTGLQVMQQIGRLAVEESTAALRLQGEDAIRQKAYDVSRQVAIYLQAHAGASMADIRAGDEFRSIAVQRVGQSGYTVLYEAGTGIVRLHPNAGLIDHPMSEKAGLLPDFWKVFAPSLAGIETAGYYDWMDVDGSIRPKYMVMVPVPAQFHGTTLMVAATTYIDEFSRPMTSTAAKIAVIAGAARQRLMLSLLIVAVLAVGVAVWLARSIGRPLARLMAAAETLEAGEYRPDLLLAEVRRSDDLGSLSRTFHRMAREVASRETRLKKQVEELRIEIDEFKKARQVAEITETEYFRQLQIKVALLRSRRSRPA